MLRLKFAFLAPVLFVLFSNVKARGINSMLQMPAQEPHAAIVNSLNNATTKSPSTSNIQTTSITTEVEKSNNGSISSTMQTTITTTQSYVGPKFHGMLKRLLYVTLVISAFIGLYFLIKYCRSGRRKPRKYGVVKTPGDMEMRPLESDDDEEDDVTMFNRKD